MALTFRVHSVSHAVRVSSPARAGAVHAGHAAPLHLLAPRDDAVGARHLRGAEAPGDPVCGRPRSRVGARSPPSLPRQVKPSGNGPHAPALRPYYPVGQASVRPACPRLSSAVLPVEGQGRRGLDVTTPDIMGHRDCPPLVTM